MHGKSNAIRVSLNYLKCLFILLFNVIACRDGMRAAFKFECRRQSGYNKTGCLFELPVIKSTVTHCCNCSIFFEFCKIISNVKFRIYISEIVKAGFIK